MACAASAHRTSRLVPAHPSARTTVGGARQLSRPRRELPVLSSVFLLVAVMVVVPTQPPVDDRGPCLCNFPCVFQAVVWRLAAAYMASKPPGSIRDGHSTGDAIRADANRSYPHASANQSRVPFSRRRHSLRSPYGETRTNAPFLVSSTPPHWESARWHLDDEPRPNYQPPLDGVPVKSPPTRCGHGVRDKGRAAELAALALRR